MNNFYFYFFYRLAKFIKAVGKNSSYTFASYTFISACLGLNIISFIFLLGHKNLYQNSHLLSLLVCGPILILNYFILMFNNKDKKIFEYYNEQNESHTKTRILGVLIGVYVFASFFIAIYLAIIVRT